MIEKSIDNLLNVFISSKDILKKERDIIEGVVKSLNMNPIRAETDKYYATPNPEEYLRQLERSHIIILLLDLNAVVDDEKIYYHFVKKEIDSAFALGITVLAFFKYKKDTEKIDIFVNEVQYKLFSHKFRTLDNLASATRDSILNEVFRKYIKVPQLLSSSRQIYNETAKLMSKCKYRFYLSQQTPTILLGPRIGKDYENAFFNKLMVLVNSIQKNNELELVFVFDSIKTDIELENNRNNYDMASIEKNISFFENIFKSNPEINMSIIDRSSNVVQFVVSDAYYLFGNHTTDIAFAVLDENPMLIKEISLEIWRMTSYKKDSGIDVFKELFEKYS